MRVKKLNVTQSCLKTLNKNVCKGITEEPYLVAYLVIIQPVIMWIHN